MGSMFSDHVNTKRTEWTFKYTGADLIEAAKHLYIVNSEAEVKARNSMSGYMLDANISQNDPKISDTKKLIEKHGLLKEQLSVWIHEFQRNPEKEYTLGLGDVTFFELEKNGSAQSA